MNGLCSTNGGGSVQAPVVRLGSHSNNLCGVHKAFFLLQLSQRHMGIKEVGEEGDSIAAGSQGMRRRFWDIFPLLRRGADGQGFPSAIDSGTAKELVKRSGRSLLY